MASWIGRSVAATAIALPLLALPLGGVLLTASGAAAQQPDAAQGHDNPDDKRLQLRGLQDTIDASDARRKSLDAEIATLEKDRTKFKADLIDTTAKVSADETKAGDARARLDVLTDKEAATRHSLESRRAVVAEVLAALQRMGRKPPPALLVEPDDVLKAIRTSMLLGAVLPGMQAETEALVADLAQLSQTRKAIEVEKAALDADLAALSGERERLTALVEARQAALDHDDAQRDDERDKAKQLAEQAGSLRDLIGRMERDSTAAAKGAAAAKQADEKLAALSPNGAAIPNPTPFKDPARLAPAVAFASTKGLLPLPVGGTVLRRFGEDDGLGGAEKGQLFETRPSGVVAAPADGWIAYAGPYRSYGQLLILNAGGGYYIVLAGMERINVDLGQFVLAGEPIAAMGDGSKKTAAATALGVAQPVLYVEFRKDGATFDPGPWWAKPELQKVRG
jgi:septal ring factor EnvC (AmiA/AmiB activator)